MSEKKNIHKSIYDFIDKGKLDSVMKPISEAHGLPNECYNNSSYFRYEQNKIFENKWIVIGVGNSVPEIGDAKPHNFLGIPLIIIRGKDQKIRVFHNVCSHRGFKILNDKCNLRNVIRCPYHSWTYDFSGKLISTPHIGGLNKHEIKQFDKNKNNLKEVKTKIWMDMIFINLNRNEINFDEYIKPLEDRWSKFISKEDQNLIVHAKDYGYLNINVKSNWKFAIENYCESYHLPTIHSSLNKVSNINDHYHIVSSTNRFAGQGSTKYNQPIKGNRKFDNFPNWPKEFSKTSEYVAFFPNVMIGLHIDHFYIFWLEPILFDKTKEHLEIYYIGNESAKGKNLREMRKDNLKFWEKVMSEDINAIEGMQAGRNSPAYNGGNFSPVMDNPSHQFHQWVATNLI